MYYEIHGRGRPILLPHGGIAGQSLWPKTIAALAKDHQVIAPEQMGHGRTPDAPTREFSYARMAADTFALLEKLGITEVDIVGWSDGRVLGLLLAIEHPPLVRRLVTSGTNVDDEGVPPPRKAELEPTDLPAFFREAYEKYSPDGLQRQRPELMNLAVLEFLDAPGAE
jgi:pimeloyl-ACP methyl ester carboxylesterase